jgi:hypothetical protein
MTQSPVNFFGNCEASTSAPTPPCCGPSQMKEDTMYANANYATAAIVNTTSDTERKIRYFTDRLYELRSEKSDDLREQFGIQDAKPPKTPLELIQRIKDGQFVIRKSDRERDEFDGGDVWYGDAWSSIRFRDPAVKRDEEGYDRGYEALDKAYSAAKDQLYAGTDPVKVLADFQAWKYTNA